MALYDPLNGVYRKVTKSYDPVEGTYRKVIKAYDDVNGVYRQYFSSGPTAGVLAVGDSVWLSVNGALREFLVVHQGNPDSNLYDESCNGTWLLSVYAYMEDDHPFGLNTDGSHANNSYADSVAHKYLNGTFFESIGPTVKSAIKQVKIPYMKGAGPSKNYQNGSNGLTARVFLLSNAEVGFPSSSPLGAKLDHFLLGIASGDMNNRRRCLYVGTTTACNWATRSPSINSDLAYEFVNKSGAREEFSSTNSAVRPALIIDKDAPIDQSTGKNIIE